MDTHLSTERIGKRIQTNIFVWVWVRVIHYWLEIRRWLRANLGIAGANTRASPSSALWWFPLNDSIDSQNYNSLPYALLLSGGLWSSISKLPNAPLSSCRWTTQNFSPIDGSVFSHDIFEPLLAYFGTSVSLPRDPYSLSLLGLTPVAVDAGHPQGRRTAYEPDRNMRLRLTTRW